MEFTTILFYAFSTILLLSALQVVTTRNPVAAALFLVLSFCTASGIWMLLKAEFLAVVLVLVYVGAVMVLFLFVVMMLDLNVAKLREGFWKGFPLAAGVGVLIALEMAAILWRSFMRTDAQGGVSLTNQIGDTKHLGVVIFTQYQLAFEIAAAILLLAIVAAVALTYRRRKDTRAIPPALAVKVQKTDRLRIIQVPVEQRLDSADKNKMKVMK